jgi:hypothetical protein
VTVKVAAEKYIADQKRQFPSLLPVQMSDNVRRAHERLNIDGDRREHEIIEKIEFLIQSRFVQYCDKRKIRHIGDVEYEHLTEFLDGQPGRAVYQIVDSVRTTVRLPQSDVTKQKALSKNPTEPVFHEAFSKAMNSIFVAAKR